MDLRIFMEWNNKCGLTLQEMYPIQEGIEEVFKEKSYGSSVEVITILLICRDNYLKQRKRYKKEEQLLEYDLILDFYLIKNVSLEEKKNLIRYQMTKITEETFRKYKWQYFDTEMFLRDFKNAVESIQW